MLCFKLPKHSDLHALCLQLAYCVAIATVRNVVGTVLGRVCDFAAWAPRSCSLRMPSSSYKWRFLSRPMGDMYVRGGNSLFS